jgi:hypothetical protein
MPEQRCHPLLNGPHHRREARLQFLIRFREQQHHIARLAHAAEVPLRKREHITLQDRFNILPVDTNQRSNEACGSTTRVAQSQHSHAFLGGMPSLIHLLPFLKAKSRPNATVLTRPLIILA